MTAYCEEYPAGKLWSSIDPLLYHRYHVTSPFILPGQATPFCLRTDRNSTITSLANSGPDISLHGAQYGEMAVGTLKGASRYLWMVQRRAVPPPQLAGNPPARVDHRAVGNA